MVSTLTTQQKIAVLTQKLAIIVQSANKVLENIAVKENGITYMPITENELVTIQQLMNDGLIDKLPDMNDQYNRVYVTVKGYSRLLDMLESMQKDETREYQRTHARPNAFDIQHQQQK